MERFMAAVRRIFGKKEHNGENHNDTKTEPNEVQTPQRKQHPYDEVTLDDEGLNVEESPPNECQAPKRAPRSYEDVDIPVGGKVEVSS